MNKRGVASGMLSLFEIIKTAGYHNSRISQPWVSFASLWVSRLPGGTAPLLAADKYVHLLKAVLIF